MKKLDDLSPMPFGRHKGDPMKKVPASYLIHLYDDGLSPGPVRSYIDENLDALRAEVKHEWDCREARRALAKRG